MARVSSNYHEIDEAEALTLMRRFESDGSCWDDPETARRQRELGWDELSRFAAGEPVAPFAALVKLVDDMREKPRSILDVGCGAGYYGGLFRWKWPWIAYGGMDASDAMVRVTKNEGFSAVRGSNCVIPFGDCSFDMVIEGCTLCHTADWAAALAEVARVADRWLLVHRTQFTTDQTTRYYEKEAYGLPCVERHLGANDFEKRLTSLGFAVRAGETVSLSDLYVVRSLLTERFE